MYKQTGNFREDQLVNDIWFGLVYLFIHSLTYLTLDTSITDYNLQHNL